MKSQSSFVPRSARSGYTLAETILVLGFLGVSVATAIPRFQDARDRIAVGSAREELIGLLSRARYHAVLRGGAVVMLSELLHSVTLQSSAGVVEVREFNGSFGVELEIQGAGEEISLRFDALGLGRVASRTLVLRRGDAEARVILSSYGRARRG